MHAILLFIGNADANESHNNSSTSSSASDDALLLSQETMSLQLAMEKPTSSYASELPQEVLVIVMSFGQVGRVCKSWSLAMSTRTFSNSTVLAR